MEMQNHLEHLKDLGFLGAKVTFLRSQGRARESRQKTTYSSKMYAACIIKRQIMWPTRNVGGDGTKESERASVCNTFLPCPETWSIHSGIGVPAGWFQVSYGHVCFSSSYIVDKVRVPFIAPLSHTLLYCHVRGWFAVLCSNLAFQLSTLRQLWKSAVQLRCFEKVFFFAKFPRDIGRHRSGTARCTKLGNFFCRHCTLLIQQPSSRYLGYLLG